MTNKEGWMTHFREWTRRSLILPNRGNPVM